MFGDVGGNGLFDFLLLSGLAGIIDVGKEWILAGEVSLRLHRGQMWM